jgi:hypothetical protein
MEFHWFDSITICMLLVFMYGIVISDSKLFMELNFIIKVLIALYLIYHFNDFRSERVKFTTLDKKICYSAGIYLFIFSFADVFDNYFAKINKLLTQVKDNLLNKIV